MNACAASAAGSLLHAPDPVQAHSLVRDPEVRDDGHTLRDTSPGVMERKALILFDKTGKPGNGSFSIKLDLRVKSDLNPA